MCSGDKITGGGDHLNAKTEMQRSRRFWSSVFMHKGTEDPSSLAVLGKRGLGTESSLPSW